MKESTSCAAAVGCVPISVLTAAAGGRRRRAAKSMAGNDGENASRTNGQQTERERERDASPDRYKRPSTATHDDDRQRRLEEIEHDQV